MRKLVGFVIVIVHFKKNREEGDARRQQLTNPDVRKNKMKTMRLLALVILATAICGLARANEFPFGLKATMKPAEVRRILQKKPNFREMTLVSKDDKISFSVGDFAMNGVGFESVIVRYYKGSIITVTFEGKDIKDLDSAYAGIVKVKAFYEAQGLKATSEELSNVTKGADLMKGKILVTFGGSPCDIDIRSAYSKNYYPIIQYSHMATISQRAADSQKKTREDNKKALDLLK